MENIELNTIIQGDCLDLFKGIKDHSIDAIITDPPYFLGVTNNGMRGTYSDLIIMKPFFENLFFEYRRVLKKTGCLYMCCDWRTYPFLYPLLEEYITIRNLLVWNKKSGPGTFYSFSHEFIIFGMDIPKHMNETSVLTIPAFASGAKKTNGEKVHPTQKPIELFEKFILDSTDEGDTVLDTFAGSGTLAIAAMRTKRNYICFELQEKYVKIATERIEAYKGNFNPDIKNYNTEITLFNQHAINT
ncbi:MAG: site-specific DNA-methyltransferase [Tannerellaceae bacterium]|jgi:site-specific DNA-methyltransferase (adenine-specific)|nr:site-specific DNA-methyltransferase [Tannerellaceae bacterium]